MTIDLELIRLKQSERIAIRAAASPGPWIPCRAKKCKCGYIFTADGEAYLLKVLAIGDDVDPVCKDEERLADMAFVVHASGDTAIADIDALLAEVERLRSGNFSPEEIHDICHNLHGKVSARGFADGCVAEQRKLYGVAPDADEVEQLRKKLAAAYSVLETYDILPEHLE